MNKKETPFNYLLAVSRVSAILVNILKDRVISIYMTDTYMSVKFRGVLSEDEIRKFNFCVGSIFMDLAIRPTWSINFENAQKDLDFTKANSCINMSIPSVIDKV